ncbi:MAG TPA: FAD-binding oxidoreductase [Alphaproteobacteria bacterium]|nr:FAD-binding oxidoreductase [Alphaproteobacteria bacterium]
MSAVAAPPVPQALSSAPYWWEAAPRPSLPETALPASVDVAVVGSGITGLNAARLLARAGRKVLVLEAQEPGYGGSSRNAGYVGRVLMHSLASLIARHGEARALAIYRELRAAYDAVGETVREEAIECAYRVCGRFIAANSPRQYEELARELELRKRHLGDEFEMVPRAAQQRELGSELYHGGALILDFASLHPGLYHLGLLQSAVAAGAAIAAHTAVEAVRGSDSGPFDVVTSRGRLQARNVVVATNGYTGAAVGWLRRRVVPFDAYMIATAPLHPELLARLLPQDRTVLDTNHNLNYVRCSPDGTRLLMGGRTGSRLPTPEAAASRLVRELARIFPDLARVELSHSWTGRCAATFDFFPHIGVHQGIHYALGYCFAGIPMGTHFGRKLALKILGSKESATAFDDRPFPTLPLYNGNPWLVPHVMRGVDLVDRWHARGGLH